MLAAAVWDRSQGVPFFIEELVPCVAGRRPRRAGESEGSSWRRGREVPLPDTVRDAVLVRADALEPRPARPRGGCGGRNVGRSASCSSSSDEEAGIPGAFASGFLSTAATAGRVPARADPGGASTREGLDAAPAAARAALRSARGDGCRAGARRRARGTAGRPSERCRSSWPPPSASARCTPTATAHRRSACARALDGPRPTTRSGSRRSRGSGAACSSRATSARPPRRGAR